MGFDCVTVALRTPNSKFSMKKHGSDPSVTTCREHLLVFSCCGSYCRGAMTMENFQFGVLQRRSLLYSFFPIQMQTWGAVLQQMGSIFIQLTQWAEE